MHPGPLTGVRVLELGQIVAGPFAGALLGWLGAEVVKVEPPGGDVLRGWRTLDADGTSLWWRSVGRNKRSVVIDLRTAEGQDLVRGLAADSDVLIENFRPGTLEGWGLSPASLQAAHPDLIVCRVSGYGQTGPYADRPGFASVCEAVAGLRSVIGTEAGEAVRPNLSLGDTLAGLHAALGILAALYHRDARGGAGQVVDVAITEAVLAVLEGMVPEAARGVVRQPSGSSITGVAPTGTWTTRDGRAVVIGANGESMFRRLCAAMGAPELGADPRFANNAQRVAHRALLDAHIAVWVGHLPFAEVEAALQAAGVPFGPIQDAADLLADPHFQARGVFETVDVDGAPLPLGALAPRLTATPGQTTHGGPALGADTDAVLGGRLALTADRLAALRAAGVIA